MFIKKAIPVLIALMLVCPSLAEAKKAKRHAQPNIRAEAVLYLSSLELLLREFEMYFRQWDSFERPVDRTPKTDSEGHQLFWYSNGVMPYESITCDKTGCVTRGIPVYNDDLDAARYNNYYRSVIQIAKDRVQFLNNWIKRLRALKPPSDEVLRELHSYVLAISKRIAEANEYISKIQYMPYASGDYGRSEEAKAYSDFERKFTESQLESVLTPKIICEYNIPALRFVRALKSKYQN